MSTSTEKKLDIFSALNKKVDGISKEKDCTKVKLWQKSIKNHLYWSASGSSCGEETVARWTSLLNHIQNVHVHENQLFPECVHPPSTDKHKWLKPGMFLFNRNYVIWIMYYIPKCHTLISTCFCFVFGVCLFFCHVIATKATYKLEKALMNKRVLADVKKLSPHYQTSALEGYHSLILRFAPKNVVFSYLGMLCR